MLGKLKITSKILIRNSEVFFRYFRLLMLLQLFYSFESHILLHFELFNSVNYNLNLCPDGRISDAL